MFDIWELIGRSYTSLSTQRSTLLPIKVRHQFTSNWNHRFIYILAQIGTVRACQGWSVVVNLLWASRWDHDAVFIIFDGLKNHVFKKIVLFISSPTNYLALTVNGEKHLSSWSALCFVVLFIAGLGHYWQNNITKLIMTS